MRRRAVLLCLALATGFAWAGAPLALPAPPRASLEQRIGARLPLELAVTDETGRAQRLSDFVGGSRPVLLVPGYYRCPQLCGLVMQGLLDALQQSGVPRSGWRIVRFSLDAHETAADARVRRDADLAYAAAIAGAQRAVPDLHLVTLAPADIARLADAIGDRFARVDDAQAGAAAIAHPATVVVVSRAGAVSRYFNGVGVDANELRVALADADGDRAGGVSARIALLCAHFDPRLGRWDAAVMNGFRAGSALLVAGLAGWCWRRRGGRA